MNQNLVNQMKSKINQAMSQPQKEKTKSNIKSTQNQNDLPDLSTIQNDELDVPTSIQPNVSGPIEITKNVSNVPNVPSVSTVIEKKKVDFNDSKIHS